MWLKKKMVPTRKREENRGRPLPIGKVTQQRGKKKLQVNHKKVKRKVGKRGQATDHT